MWDEDNRPPKCQKEETACKLWNHKQEDKILDKKVNPGIL